MNKYEIHIGEIFDLTTNSKKPKQTIIITQDQMVVIEQFASQRKDAGLNTIYKLNECEFRIYPHFNLKAKKLITDYETEQLNKPVISGSYIYLVHDCDRSSVLFAHLTEESAEQEVTELRKGFVPSVIFDIQKVEVK